jgi:hypothetical protein
MNTSAVAATASYTIEPVYAVPGRPIRHIMVDIKTTGNRPGCRILSIAACAFDPETGDTWHWFEIGISCAGQTGLIDPDTMRWWAEEAPEAEEPGGLFAGFGFSSTGGGTSTLLQGFTPIDFRLWHFSIESWVDYAFERGITEDISFNVIADVQDVVNDADDPQSEIVTLSSGNVGTLVGIGSDAEMPIGSASASTQAPSMVSPKPAALPMAMPRPARASTCSR